MPNGKKNFGDELGPFIVGELSGLKIKYIPIVNSPIKTIAIYLLGLFKGNYYLKDLFNVFYSLNKNNILLTIGSILGSNKKKTSLIWGTGLMSENDKIINANFYAVRGKYSQHKIKQLGYNVPTALGDPALLMPLIIKPSEKKYQLGIIPHYIHFNDIKNKLNTEDVLIINLLEDLSEVVKKITSCETTISTSLHGLIVSHAYSIPSLWYTLSNKQLAGDNIKFKDYFSSVHIDEYNPFTIHIANFNKKEIILNIQNHTKINCIQNDLHIIQKELINSAPFPILDMYKV